jgi:SAM-dependent methyltransferase
MTTDADNIVGLYERHALQWASDRSRPGRFMERDWLDRFTALITPGGTILYIGCGFGKPIAAHLIAQGFDVCGIDSSPTMISLCQRDFPDHEWLVGDMRTFALSRRFDGIIAWDSFFHLTCDDQRKMFPRFRDHALPGAPLIFTSGPSQGEAIGDLHGEALFHASLDPEEYRALLAASNFDVVDHRPDDPECGGHTIWLARRHQKPDRATC